MSAYQLGFAPMTPDHVLPTNLTTGRHPIHRWYNFIAGFSPEFVGECISAQQYEGQFNDLTLIDPFAGCGTSLVEANFRGIASVGFEPHPFFADVTGAKTEFPTDDRAWDIIREVACGCLGQPAAPEEVWGPDALRFLRKLIPSSELPILARAVLQEAQIPVGLQPIYRMAMSRVLELTSFAQTDGIYKAPASSKSSKSFRFGLREVLGQLRTDVDMLDATWKNRSRLIRHSAEAMPELATESCTISVTSPPYLNNFDFAEMTRMEIYFWRIAGSWREITEKVRRNLVVNTTTAPTDMKRSQDRYRRIVPMSLQSTLHTWVDLLTEEKARRAGKKDYHLLIFPYFGQMTEILQETWRVLRPGGSLYMIVADSALYGVHIHTESVLSQIMVEVGFDDVVVHSLRDRGNRWILHKRLGPPKGLLGEFCIRAIKH